MSDSASRPVNRLAREKSPYLLQHARNPVDWYPWGEEAFARARAEDKPIFLSIGYSTCHWCHVMERESFENDAIAELLNAHFVPVKVDREERPDVDRLYMASAQAMRVGGGWPLNMFLTPALEPFFGGTYFPPSSRGGRPGMTDLLPRVHAAWLEQREQIAESGARVLALVGAMAEPEGAAQPADALALECVQALERSFDRDEGGFGTAPKFPSTANLAFLFRWWARDPDARGLAREMALRQLDAMQAGGIHDALGGGFHRYSTDREWLVPHFEKMLYDQALIADAYLDGFEITREPAYERTLRALFGYVLRDLASPQGAFWSAEDADSEGEEGLFYVWTPAQLAEVLGEAEAAFVAAHWDVTPQGNFEHGASILHAAAAPAAAADRARLEAAREKLLAARTRRVRPHLDDKVLAAWNGLMIAAMARGARVLHDPELGQAAARAGAFAWEHLRDPESGALWRRWREGEAAVPGQLDDHAYVARGFLELYATTHDVKWLQRAVALTEVTLERFWDEAHGAFFDSPAGDASVRVRMKDGFDGAELAGNSVAAANLVRLSALLPREGWRERARRVLDYHARRLSGNAWAMPMMLVAMDLAARPPRHIVIAGDASPERDALLAVYQQRFRPFDDLIVVDDRSRAVLSELAPFTARMRAIDEHATAFLCLDQACKLPATNPEMFSAQLDDRAPAGAGTENA